MVVDMLLVMRLFQTIQAQRVQVSQAEVRVVNGGFTIETEDRTGFQLIDEDGGILIMGTCNQ